MLGGNLIDLRIESGMKTFKIAKELGITRQQLNNIERGVNRLNLDKIEKLSRLYKKSKHEIIKAWEAGRFEHLRKESECSSCKIHRQA